MVMTDIRDTEAGHTIQIPSTVDVPQVTPFSLRVHLIVANQMGRSCPGRVHILGVQRIVFTQPLPECFEYVKRHGYFTVVRPRAKSTVTLLRKDRVLALNSRGASSKLMI